MLSKLISKGSRFIRKGSLLHHVSLVAGGAVVGQGLMVLSVPVLTRLYGPADFGGFQGYFSLICVLITVADLGYEKAIPVTRDNTAATNLFAICIIVCLAGAFCLALGLFLLDRLSMNLVGVLCQVPSRPAKLLVPIGMLLGGWRLALEFWCYRKKLFWVISVTQGVQGGVCAITQCILGVAAPTLGATGLVVGFLAGQLISLCVMFWLGLAKELPVIGKEINASSAVRQAKTSKQFLLYGLPGSVVENTSANLPGFVLPPLFGATALGFYSLAYRSFSLPMFLLSRSYSLVFYQRACEYHNSGDDLLKFVIKSYKVLLGISIGPGLVLLVFAPALFEMIFGTQWRVAGEWTRFILPWLVTNFIVGPSLGLFLIFGKQRQLFGFNAAMLVCRILAIFLGYYVFKDPAYSIGFYSLVGFLGKGFMALQVVSLIKQHSEIKTLRPYGRFEASNQ